MNSLHKYFKSKKANVGDYAISDSSLSRIAGTIRSLSAILFLWWVGMIRFRAREEGRFRNPYGIQSSIPEPQQYVMLIKINAPLHDYHTVKPDVCWMIVVYIRDHTMRASRRQQFVHHYPSSSEGAVPLLWSKTLGNKLVKNAREETDDQKRQGTN